MTVNEPTARSGGRRLARRVGLALLAIAFVAAAALYVLGRHTLPQTSGRRAVTGLAHPVEIWRDLHGVPHVFAGSPADAWFALGYVHAQDRIWQMEVTRRLGAGRLAEVVGRPALDADRFFRTLGLYRLAELQSRSLSADVRDILESYASGVNAWLRHRAAGLPPEFLLFRHEPEPWRVADSLVWGRLLAFQLSTNWTTELLRAQLASRVPKSLLVDLWPVDPQESPTTIQTSGRAAADFRQLIDRLGPLPSWLEPQGASNAWVIGPDRSTTGAPLLANDTHLALTAPNPWYLARLVAPGLALTGATAPGAPFVLLGHNGSVAWGMTSTGGDTQDLFVETIDPSDRERYLTPDGPQYFRVRHETIQIKGHNPVELTVRTTRHGPVISDILAEMNAVAGMNSVIALASSSEADVDATAEALADMMLARDSNAFAAAAERFEAPALNIFFADTNGGFGMIAPGRIPLRRRGDGSLPVAGADGRQDWVGSIPTAERPRVLNPSAGFLLNANNRLIDDGYPWLISRDWEEPYRARRILEYLTARPLHSLDDMQTFQTDLDSGAARELLPLLLDRLEPVGDDVAEAAAMLRRWDFRMLRDRPEPLLYAAWLREVMRGIAEDELGSHFPSYWRNRPRFIRETLKRNRHWCGDARSRSPSDCGPILHAALGRALVDLRRRLGHDMAGWRWGDLHRAVFRHQTLGSLALLSWLVEPSIATDGGDHTVNVGSLPGGAAREPFTHVHGSVFRAVYDLSDLPASRYMIPAGQSGNPLSSHYRDLLAPWRNGGHIEIAGTREQLANAGYDHLVLMPVQR
ncbi:MAG: penicillin acylase family protein [Rhodospirillales bacterium]|nr:MAG: penicillin acylase family protein [Rhodospirillales bacterium]